MKVEASGFPRWCNSDAQKEQFIKMYKEREGIDLDPENMVKNPGLRSLAKLALNSLWGRFGIRGKSDTVRYS